ncbi:FAD-binding domain-containing protein [Phenylobacterium sp.]|jgi:deoxyribodipyrimidine photo-lyase|uniref:FAD-binding domain-containing protein n=1 Tax=Phenylobacterium sp. TaxID=1871053 RepID=UPI0037C719D5
MTLTPDRLAATNFPPSRQAALDRLAGFAPRAGRAYDIGRNADPGPDQPGAVSRLSPCTSRRLITEQEIVEAVLALHRLEVAEKYVQEVLWRTYWKGWLELRPSVWTRFLETRERSLTDLADSRVLADAERGTTGIEGFDDWARELVQTGYLHNHARMWFASIWIFTLGLPWALGADFFLRHLVDADAASNTLSWRWVAGLQTPGKTYLATASNIERYTEGRFAPKGLVQAAVAMTEPPVGPALPLAPRLPTDLRQPFLLLVTPDDLHPESLLPVRSAVQGAVVAADPALSWGEAGWRFTDAAARDSATRAVRHFGCPVNRLDRLAASDLATAAGDVGVSRIVTAFAPVGPTAQALARLAPELALAGITLVQVRRDWDDAFWPLATKGFFAFKDRIPAVLGELGVS